jgi:ABC-type Zn uptake system ZnuABC Zn-binding protein ZnuA
VSVFVWRPLILGIMTPLLLLACTGQDDERPLVLATTAILADLARQVAGDALRVEAIVPAEADPHTFDITPAQARRIGQARLIFANGLGLEGPLLDSLLAHKAAEAPLLAVGEAVGQRLGLSSGVSEDPHLWLDPRLAAEYVLAMAEALAGLDPAGAEGYRGRAQQYVGQLRALDEEAGRTLQALPPQRRQLVASHAAFHWLARRYGLQEVGYLVSSPEAEPSPAQVAALRQRLQQQRVPAVFVEPQLEGADRLLARLAQDLGLRVCTLYSDAFDDRVRSYLELMRHNGRELARCLGEG